MGDTTKIQWADHTWNGWRGCTKVSAGCAHCYAEATSGRNRKVLGIWGEHGVRHVAAESYWRDPVKWDRRAAQSGAPSCHDDPRPGLRPRVFSLSLGDVFEDFHGRVRRAGGGTIGVCGECRQWVHDPRFVGDETDQFALEPCPHCREGEVEQITLDDVRTRLFKLIDDTPHLDWLVLTKRPQNILDVTQRCQESWWYKSLLTMPANVWLGTSVEDQETADARIPHLLRVPAAVRFLSVEPLLSAVNLDLQGIDWVIAGSESGPHRRPMATEWAASIREQCRAAGVAFFMKQMSVGGAVTGDVETFPKNLQVRENPTCVRGQ